MARRPTRRPRFATACALFLAACGGTDPSTTQWWGCVPEGSIGLGSSVVGTLAAGDCSDRTDLPYPSSRYDIWTFNLTRTTAVVVDASFDSEGASMQLHSVADNEAIIGVGLPEPRYPATTMSARIIDTLAAGAYGVSLRIDDRLSSDYTLALDVAADCTPLGPLAVQDTVSGTLAAGDCPFAFGTLSDNWTLDLPVDTVVRVDLISSDFEPVVVLYEDDSFVDVNSRASDGTPTDRARMHLSSRPSGSTSPGAPGPHTVAVTATRREAVGDYRLAAVLSPACALAGSIGLDDTASGELTDDDCFTELGTQDVWLLEIPQDTTVSVSMTSGALAPFIRLVDEGAPNDRASAMGSGGPGTAVLSGLRLAAGRYEIRPTHSKEVGAYDLAVTVD